MKRILEHLKRSFSASLYGLGRRLFGGLHLRKRLPWVGRLQNALARAAHPERVTVNGVTLYLDVAEGIRADADFEPETTELFRRLIRPGNVIADVGADIGYYTCLAAKLAGEGGRVFSFEPNAHSFALLKKNVDANDFRHITLVPYAVSDKKETLPLFANGPHTSVGYDRFAEGAPSAAVETVILDDHLRDSGQRLDLLKIDVEGSEGKVLRGARQLMAKNARLMIVMEFYPYLLRKNGDDPLRLLQDIVRQGFALWDIQEGKEVGEQTTPEKLIAKYPASEGHMTNLLMARPGAYTP